MKKLIPFLFLLIACAKNTAQNSATDNTEKILGADISFLPELEAAGIKFSDKNIQKDALLILKDHGINYIRLRIFNNPAADSGYSPIKGFCNLEHTKQMAKRIKDAGMKFLLDFHYSDTWADPGKQNKPAAWQNLNFPQLTQAVHDYTFQVLTALQQQNTLPNMVQIGNEINHGILWTDGNSANMDNLAALIASGIKGVRDVDPKIKVMLHIACGGQNAESIWFLNNMIQRNISFDVIGQSYYPQWHGTLTDLQNNLTDLSKKYTQDIIVVEYSEYKKEVNDIAFGLLNKKMQGTFIWEPLNTWEQIFEKNGASNNLINVYDAIKTKYNIH